MSPGSGALLDLGCGPGKIARELAGQFAAVTAVDPSVAMLALAREGPNGRSRNIRWIRSLAEDADYGNERFDVVVAASSVHWMDHDRLFRRLADHVAADHTIVIVAGDDAWQPPWQTAWREFLARWIRTIKNEPLWPPGKWRVLETLDPWIEFAGDDLVISPPITQSITDYVACQHSRDTFSRRRLGDRLESFDRELTELLRPHASDGDLRYRVGTRIAWGRLVSLDTASE